MAFIDSDDIWERDKLKYQLQFMLSNKYNFTYTDYKLFFEYLLIQDTKKAFARNFFQAKALLLAEE